MKHIFSNSMLLTLGSNYSSYKGSLEIKEEYPDSTVVVTAEILKKIKEETDTDNNHYTWYEIDNLERTINNKELYTQGYEQALLDLAEMEG